MIQNLENKMELQINSLETRIEKMQEMFNKDLEEIKTTSPSNAGGAWSIPGWGAKIPHASWPKNIKQKQHCNKFNNDL